VAAVIAIAAIQKIETITLQIGTEFKRTSLLSTREAIEQSKDTIGERRTLG
jgi:hypothetical protein